MTPSAPTYPLEQIQRLVSAGPKHYRITGTSAKGARLLGLDAVDIKDCVLSLDASCFHKTMPSRTMPGSFQDVYRAHYEGHDLYVKLQMARTDLVVVISFKEL